MAIANNQQVQGHVRFYRRALRPDIFQNFMRLQKKTINKDNKQKINKNL